MPGYRRLLDNENALCVALLHRTLVTECLVHDLYRKASLELCRMSDTPIIIIQMLCPAAEAAVVSVGEPLSKLLNHFSEASMAFACSRDTNMRIPSNWRYLGASVLPGLI